MRSRRLALRLRRRLLAAAVGSMVALTGCSEVPSSSEPKLIKRLPTRAAVSDQRPGSGARVVPAPPRANALPEEVVRGFLGAHADATDSRLTAQQYVTTAAAWDPAARVDTHIYAFANVAEREARRAPDARIVDATFELRGRIRPDGEYVPDVRTLRRTYTLRGSEARWRLSEVPPGLWIELDALDQAFRRVEPLFVTPDGKALIRDPAYLPRTIGSEVSAVVQRLISGPTERLRSSGVTTYFPAGTQLRTVPDPIDGMQQLNFSSQLADAPAPARSRIAAQLVWTLSAELDVDAVEIEVEGEPFIVSAQDEGEPQERDRFAAYGPDDRTGPRVLYFNHARRLVSFRAPTDVRVGRALGTGRQPAVDRLDSRLAVVHAAARGGVELLVGPIDGKLESRLRGKHLTDPSWGAPQEGVWAVRQDAGAAAAWLVPQQPQGRPRALFALPGSDRVLAFEVAPDGVQVAMIIQRGRKRELRVGLIYRDPAGRPAGLVGIRAVAPEHYVTQVTWVDRRELAFIGRSASRSFSVWRGVADGSAFAEVPTSAEKLAPNRQGRERLLGRPESLAIAVEPQLIYQHNGAAWADSSNVLEP